MLLALDQARIGVIGLGYVGLPLALELGKKYPTVGFDIKAARVAELQAGSDSTLEASPEELAAATELKYTSETEPLAECNVYIVTVPTPIGLTKRPILSPLKKASGTIGGVIARGDVVIFESTVYPGCTEEICVPLIERVSGLTLNKDFYVGYSPERINPGDREHRLPVIRKVTSGSTPEAAEFVDSLYASIVTAGTHRASSIRVAEAAKVIENTQRDVNIALINELAMIFNKLGIDTGEVLAAAASKWNFLQFKPGLVGGHCIGVDPYYLTHKAEEIGYHPEMILAGRRLNDHMGQYVASSVIKLMVGRNIQPVGARVLVLGITFKENCPDVRNTRVVDLVRELESYRCEVDVHDPWANPEFTREEHGISLVELPKPHEYEAVVIAVAHRQFAELGAGGIRELCTRNAVIYDIKHLLQRDEVDGRL